MSAVMNAVTDQFLRGRGVSTLRTIRNEPAGASFVLVIEDKFTKEGHVRLHIQLESVAADGIKALRFSVSDTGLGIQLEKQELISEMFTQVEGSIHRQMGGRLEDSSVPFRGSTFSFAIPFAPGPRQTPSPDAATGLPPDEGPAGRLRILLAEDSPDNQLLISAFLKQTAMTLEIAENGQVAVDKFIAGPFDVVLMDVQMPVMDGFTAARTIRAWEARQGARRTPILTLSAHAMEDAFQNSLAAGCNAHLTKPILKAALLKAIVEHCKARVPIYVRPPKEVEKLAPWYLDRRRADLVTLTAALQAGNYDAIRVLGHDMKGSGKGYGFDAISKVGASLEAEAKKQAGGEIGTPIRELGDYLERVEIISA